MDELLLDYLLDQLPPGDRRVVAGLIQSDPTVAARVRTLSAALVPLAADLEPDAPPPGLALDAIAHTAAFVVANGLFTARDGFGPPSPDASPAELARESRWLPLVRGWVNAAVVATVAVLTVGLGLAAIQRGRQSYQQTLCQDNLRELHAGLSGYSELNGGRYPQVGTATVPTAGRFYDELASSGQPVSEAARGCPLVSLTPAEPVGYAYSLGFRDPQGRLTGLRRPETAEDLTPIVSDLPGGGHGGWNVLHVGGSVRFTRTGYRPASGDDRFATDDLFSNDDRRTGAGLHRGDVCLGRPFDVP